MFGGIHNDLGVEFFLGPVESREMRVQLARNQSFRAARLHNDLNEADYVGDTIVVHTGPDGKGAENFSLRISRRGPLLKIRRAAARRRPNAPAPKARDCRNLFSEIVLFEAILTVHPPPRAYARGRGPRESAVEGAPRQASPYSRDRNASRECCV
jgi:hypothetical protein